MALGIGAWPVVPTNRIALLRGFFSVFLTAIHLTLYPAAGRVCAVHARQRDADRDASPHRDARAEHDGEAERCDRTGNADFDPREANPRRRDDETEEHRRNEGRGQQPDAGRRAVRGQDADGAHRQDVIEAAEGMGKSGEEFAMGRAGPHQMRRCRAGPKENGGADGGKTGEW